MAWPLIAAAALAAAPTVMNMFKKEKTPDPRDFYTPEQLVAQGKLSNFAQTGVFGDFRAGEQVPLEYGDYNATGIEKQGLSNLQNLLSSGMPAQYQMGDQALQDLLSTDPARIQSQFEPFKAITERNIREGERGVKRASNFAGNLYSTDTVRDLGDVNARGVETLTQQLANLTNQSLDRRLQAIPLAYQSGAAQEDIQQGRLASAFGYGGLERQLNDAAMKARDAELLRRRQELTLPMEAAATLSGQQGRSFPEISASPYQELLGQVGQIGGNYLGNELYMRQYKRFMQPAGGQQQSPIGSGYDPQDEWMV